MSHREHFRRRGFTLVELVLSMAVMTVLIGGIASAMLLASRAIPDDQSPTSVLLRGSEAAEEIAGELYTARTITERSAMAVEFTVHDRNGDEVPETLRYEWSGTAGDPLTRQYNGGTVANIAEDVQEFQLTYDLKTAQREGPRSENESAETLLISFEPTADLADFSIDANNWPGEYFLPTLPSDALSWKVTRVRFQAKVRGANDGVTKVQLRLANSSSLPTSTILEEHLLYESGLLGTYEWQEFSYTSVGGISPSQGLCLVLRFVSADVHSCDILYRDRRTILSNGAFVSTTNAGSTWTKNTAKGLSFYIYGTITAYGEPQMVDVYYLTGVRVALRLGAGAGSRVETGVQVLNKPEVPTL